MAMTNLTSQTPANAAATAGRAALNLLVLTARLGWRIGRMGARSQAVRRELAGGRHG
jgi:hypothetical protein